MRSIRMCARSDPRRAAVAVMAAAILLCSCNVKDLFDNDDVFALQVRVRNLAGLDGCGWVLEAGPHDYYEPTKLDPAFCHEGLAVWAQLRHRKDLYSFCMVGPIVDVIAMHVGADAPGWAPRQGG